MDKTKTKTKPSATCATTAITATAAATGTATSKSSTFASDSDSFSDSFLKPENLTSRWKQTLRRQLLAWYAKHARDLPWRKTQDPYRIWISEIMLQQTQVETVIDYYHRFIKTFPTITDLANASEQQVLRQWEGLGYYRRARQLHAAAQEVVEKHAGDFPSEVKTLLTLPGIGRYTAGAIASQAFNRRAPIVEANTIRLFSRLLAYSEDPTKSAGQKVLWTFAETILPQKNISAFNQSLMELGALVCTPKNPGCDLCPVKSICEARRLGQTDQIPRPKVRAKITDLYEAAIVIWHEDKILLRQCTPAERWAGLWDFPRIELSKKFEDLALLKNNQAVSALKKSTSPLDEIINKVFIQTGVTCDIHQHLTTLRHSVTRYRITLNCFEARHASGLVRSTETSPARWVPLLELGEMPLSTTGRKIARHLATT